MVLSSIVGGQGCPPYGFARNDNVFKVSGCLKLYRSSFCPCRKTVIATTAHAGVRGNLKKVHVIAKFALANCGNLLVV